MYQKTGKRVGLALLAAAVLVRAMASTEVEAFASEFDAPAFARLTLSLAAGVTPEMPPAPESRVWVLKLLPPQEEPAPEKMTFTPEEAEAIGISGGEDVDKAALLTAPFSYTPSEAPTVLIVHTHTSEAYTQTTGWTYTESDPLRTTEDDHSVIRVGAEIAAQLEARGIGVLHDVSYNDYPNYNGAYGRTLEKTAAWLTQYPTVQVVLDIHRDAMEDENGTPIRQNAALSDGTEAAKVMLVVGTDRGGLTHPGWQDNLSLAMKVQAALLRTEPGLCRDIDLRRERFNQHVSPGALLVEVGSTGNTLPEALVSARVFADSLADVLVGTP